MNFTERKLLLQDYPVSAEWVDRIPEKLWKNCSVLRIAREKTIFSKEDKSSYFYFICSGTVMVFNPDMLGNEVNVVFVNQGATLGEMEILLGKPRLIYGAKAYTDCVLLRMLAADFTFCVEQVPGFAGMVMRILAEKLQQSSMNTMQYHQMGAKSRLKLLLGSHGPGVVTQTRKELAEACGVSERTVQRAVQALKEEKLLSVEHGKIVLTQEQVERLFREAHAERENMEGFD